MSLLFLSRLFQSALPVELDEGEELYRAGTSARQMYRVRRGFFKLLNSGGSKGACRVDEFCGPGEIMGWEALTSKPYATTSVSLTKDTVVEAVGEKDLDLVLAAGGSMTVAVVTDLLLEQIEVRRQRELLRKGKRDKRLVFGTLLDLVSRFGIRKDDQLVVLPAFFSHQALADYLGVVRPYVNTIIGNLRKEGIVEDFSNGWYKFTTGNLIKVAECYDLPKPQIKPLAKAAAR